LHKVGQLTRSTKPLNNPSPATSIENVIIWMSSGSSNTQIGICKLQSSLVLVIED
jgi:hypothetical protein